MVNWMVGESAFVTAAQNSRLYLMVVDLVGVQMRKMLLYVLSFSCYLNWSSLGLYAAEIKPSFITEPLNIEGIVFMFDYVFNLFTFCVSDYSIPALCKISGLVGVWSSSV